MTWMVKPAVADEILRIRAQFYTMPSTTAAILGVQFDRFKWLEFERDVLGTLGLPDVQSSLLSALHERLASPANIPAQLSALFEGCRMNAVTAALCQHLRVDPIRLILIGACANSLHARRGQQAVDLALRSKHDQPKAVTTVEGTVRLSTQVLWRAGKLTLSQTVLPRSVTMALKGMTVDRIIDHPWKGWKKLVVTSAIRHKSAITVMTNAMEAATILA